MARQHQLSFTTLELKALRLRAEIGAEHPDLRRDPILDMAGETALDKIWRAERGMGRRPTPPDHPRPGKPTDDIFDKGAA